MDIGAEVLMVITSLIICFSIVGTAMQGLIVQYDYSNFSITIMEKTVDIILSPVFALFLPLLSYMFSQAKEKYPARAQVILIWVVLSEVIRASTGDTTWELKKSAEQVVRLVWVTYLVFSYKSLNFLTASLLVLCVVVIIFEVMKVINSYQAKGSYIIGKNPKLIHNYMKRVMLEDELRTTPMNSCDYIVMGEENHNIVVCDNGYNIGDKKSNSEGMLTIRRILQLNSSEDERFILACPSWVDTSLSFAMAKILIRRFVNLSLDEAGSTKALQFVQEGLIDYIGNNKDIPPERRSEPKRRNGERNLERVFDIIRDELKFVSELLHAKVPRVNYIGRRVLLDIVGDFIIIVMLMYHAFAVLFSSTSPSHNVQVYAYSDCSIGRRNGIFYYDKIVVWLLAMSCVCIRLISLQVVVGSKRWVNLMSLKRYIENPAEWTKLNRSVVASIGRNIVNLYDQLGNNIIIIKRNIFSDVKDVEQVRIQNSIFGIKAHSKICHTLGKWIRKNIPRLVLPTVSHSTDVKEAILSCLRNCSNQLTNGETALKNYGMLEHLNQVCKLIGSTTEAILVWHIAITLFHHQKPPPQQTTDNIKDRWVALDLSNYCFHLLAHLPELLPDEPEWTEEMYESVREEIFAIDRSSSQSPTAMNRCNYVMDDHVTWDKKSVVGKGAKLAKELVDYTDNETQVWTMLSEFWAEMILYIAPSDNVKAHEEILDKGELITQLWALLTHAGILTSPKPTEHSNNGNGSNDVTEDMIV